MCVTSAVPYVHKQISGQKFRLRLRLLLEKVIGFHFKKGNDFRHSLKNGRGHLIPFIYISAEAQEVCVCFVMLGKITGITSCVSLWET